MLKKSGVLFLMLLLILSLVACGNKTTITPEKAPEDSQEQRPGTSDSPEKTDGEWATNPSGEPSDVTYALPKLPRENRNIPEGSNVVQVGDKYIVAANMDADYYRDSSFRTFYLFVLSREPMDPDSIHVKLDRADVDIGKVYVNDLSGSVSLEKSFIYPLYYGYSDANWKEYYQWVTAFHDYQERISAGENISPPIDGEWQDFQDMSTPAAWFQRNGNPDSHIYAITLTLFGWNEETTIHQLKVSLPGVEQTIDIGEIRLHMDYIYSMYDWPDRFGLHGLTANSGSLSYMFGPEIACSITSEMTCDAEVIFKGVTSLNSHYPVVEVVLYGTAPGVEDQQILTPDHPVTVSPGAKTVMSIYFIGPHLSELTVMGQGYFLIDCEVDGQEYHFIWEGGQQRGCYPDELYAIVMDNVDMQGYYEYVEYDPFHVRTLFGTRELYDELGWTEKWEAMMAE